VRLELVPEWPDEAGEESVLEWGIFNPLGPTINTLRLTPTPAGRALVYTLYHPARSESRVMAVLPDACGPAQLAAAVVQVMGANGAHAVWMLRSLPDYVFVPPASGLKPGEVAEAIRTARAAAETSGEVSLDLGWHARRLHELARDPWGTTSREIDRASGEASGEDESGHSASSAPDARAYERWLRVAADPGHVELVRAQIPVAWERLMADDEEDSDGDS
jgi:hypothetical protein